MASIVEQTMREIERQRREMETPPEPGPLASQTLQEMQRQQSQWQQHAQRLEDFGPGIDRATLERHPTLTRVLHGATAPVRWLMDSSVGQFLQQSSAAFNERFFNQPGWSQELQQVGRFGSTGSPIADTAAQVGGDLAGLLAQYAVAHQLGGAGIAALSRIPGATRLANLAPSALQAFGRGATTGAAMSLVEDDLSPENLLQNVAMHGGFGAGGQLGRQAVHRFLPGVHRAAEAAIAGAAGGAGGAAGLALTGGDIDPQQAATMIGAGAILQGALAAFTPYNPGNDFRTSTGRIRQHFALGQEAARRGDQAALQASYRNYWEQVNQAYSAARRIERSLPARMHPNVRMQFEQAWRQAMDQAARAAQTAEQTMRNVTPQFQALPPPTRFTEAEARRMAAQAARQESQAAMQRAQEAMGEVDRMRRIVGRAATEQVRATTPLPIELTGPATPSTGSVFQDPEGTSWTITDASDDTMVTAQNPQGETREFGRQWIEQYASPMTTPRLLPEGPPVRDVGDLQVGRRVWDQSRQQYVTVTRTWRYVAQVEDEAGERRNVPISNLVWQEPRQMAAERQPTELPSGAPIQIPPGGAGAAIDTPQPVEAPMPTPEPTVQTPTPEAQPVPRPQPAQVPEAQPAEQVVPPVATPQPTPEVAPSAPEPLQPAATGRTDRALTERGTSVDVRYAVVDASQLVSSHDTRLQPDPRFPAELQPRDRTRAASEDQVARIAQRLEPSFLGESPKASEGAPIIGPDGVVESGNARTIALKRVYEQGAPQADTYRNWLAENAERFGLDPGAVANMQAPVLVRVRQSDVDRQAFVQEANEQAVAAMSATEQAQADANRLNTDLMNRFTPSESGEILTTANRDFVQRFMETVVGPSEQGRYLTAEGTISQEGLTRMRNAIFARAYGDIGAIEKLAEATDNNIRNITGAMLNAAPRLADIRDRIDRGVLHPLDLTAEIAAAANKMSALREAGESVETYLRQTAMFSDDIDPLAKDILATFDNYARSRKKLTEILMAYADAVEALGTPQQVSMFGDTDPPTKAEVLQAVINAVEVRYAEAPQTTFFEDTPVRSEEVGARTVAPVGSEEAPTQAPPVTEPQQPQVDQTQQPATGTVEEAERAMGSAVDRLIPPSDSLGIAAGTERRRDDRPRPQYRYEFDDPEIERRWQDAKGVSQETMWQRVRAGVERMWTLAGRNFEHLPVRPEYANLRFRLQTLQKQRDVASDRTLRLQQGITIDLNADQFELFTRKVILDDLAETAAEGKELPFGFTEQSLAWEKQKIDNLVSGDPDVQSAVERRRMVWDALKQDYIQAMDAIGFDVRDRLSRENYYRHQVLALVNMKRTPPTGTGQRIRTPAGRGFLRRREGSALDINTDYMQAEYEVMAQMLYDVEVARVIQLVDEEHNIRPELEDQAKRLNEQALENLIRRERAQMVARSQPSLQLGGEASQEATLKPDRTPTEEQLARFGRRIAVGFDELQGLATQGQLPLGENGQFRNVVANWSADRVTDLAETDDLVRDQLFQYLSYLASDDQLVGNVQARSILKAISERREFIRALLGDNQKTWEDLVPEGHVLWQPREGDVFFMADSVPTRIAEQLASGNLEQLGIRASDLRRVMAVGGRRLQYAIPEEVALTLDNFGQQRQPNSILRGIETLQRGWKVWQLISPPRLIRYNLRNISSDADAVAIANPQAFRYLPEVWGELYDVYFRNAAPSETLREWHKRGGMQALLQGQEMGDINQLKMFEQLQRARGTAREIPTRVWQGYWRTARLGTDFREALLRYANFRAYLEQMQASPDGRPRNFGASDREEIMALSDVYDRAFKLSNELLVAYDQISVLGQDLRRYIMPFWSWHEGNARRYVGLFRNAAEDGRLASAVGKKIASKAASPYTYYRIGALAIKALAFWALTEAWNRTFFPEESKLVPDHVRAHPFIILGRDANGNVIYFDRLGGVGDFLEWFGLNESPKYVRDFLNGSRSLTQIAGDMIAEGPTNKLIQSVSPFITAPTEAILQRQIFPDWRSPRPIRDRGLFLAESFGLGPEYRAIFGLPSHGYRTPLDLIAYRGDPDSWAYWAIRDEVRRWREAQGHQTSSVIVTDPSPRSSALYNLRLALRYQDRRAADRYLAEYAAAGGTRSGLQQSLNTLHPLHGLNASERRAFVAQLNDEERAMLALADQYHEMILEQSRQLQTTILPRR